MSNLRRTELPPSSGLARRLFSVVVMLAVTLPLLYAGGLTLALFVTILWSGLIYELWHLPNHSRTKLWTIRLLGTTLVCQTWLFAIYMILALSVGWTFFLWMLPTIWFTDSFAYLGGRFFQGPKLAPTISPNKTWSGFVCGILAGSIWSALSAGFISHSETPLWFMTPLIPITATLGDLLISKGKRLLNTKDTSTLIPGHGGLWDRLDSTLSVIWILSLLTTLWPTLMVQFLRGFVAL